MNTKVKKLLSYAFIGFLPICKCHKLTEENFKSKGGAAGVGINGYNLGIPIDPSKLTFKLDCKSDMKLHSLIYSNL